MAKASALISLIRPVNSVMIGFAVIVGVAVVEPSKILSLESMLGFFTGFFVSSYSMVINDVYDIEIDRINSPNRPIPSGTMSLMQANMFAAVLLLIGFASASLISLTNIAVAALFGLIAWGYSYWGKKRGLSGNMMVAASMAVPYVFGGVAIGKGSDVMLWSLALTSFLAGTGREVVKTISDVEGDKARDVRSIAITKGEKMASRIGALFFLAAVSTSLLPLMLGITGIVYAVLVLVTDAFFIYISAKIIRNYSVEGAIKVKKLALGGMMLGLLAFLFGGALRF
ncbi:MAG: UbiA family prenyltransferase [Thaumarchaeota archaeon]|nr:UbiA family prenyltransferase [Nitrososphaerota archaeon]